MAVITNFSRSIATTLKEGSTTLDSGGADPITADTKVDLIQSVAAATANQHFVMSILKDKLKQLYATCDVAATIYTNDLSTGTPDNNIPLSANIAKRFQAGTTDVNPVAAANVTDIYVTVAGGVAGTLRIFTLQDATP